jgi:hypothetical protein
MIKSEVHKREGNLVSNFKDVLPKEFESSLPTIEMIENELTNTLNKENR